MPLIAQASDLAAAAHFNELRDAVVDRHAKPRRA